MGELGELVFLVPSSLKAVFPYGLSKSGVLRISDSHILKALLLGIASKQGAWVAILGAKNLGWDVFFKSGLDRNRLIYVPDLDHFAPQILFAAIDGCDILLIEGIVLSQREERKVAKRARLKNTLVITTEWKTNSFLVDCNPCRVHGLCQGRGHIQEITYRVSSRYGDSFVAFNESGWDFDCKKQEPRKTLKASSSKKLMVVR
ncbi:hypothetical protein [Arcanobacterium ihumii]|uniref:hypothetical protein n=1 Tax=Arcanobacterium ihumii TaxID=2138162 RepID=UPI000F53C3C7|nr:hypothetical protein [Arcanobacterium ihumii]